MTGICSRELLAREWSPARVEVPGRGVALRHRVIRDRPHRAWGSLPLQRDHQCAEIVSLREILRLPGNHPGGSSAGLVRNRSAFPPAGYDGNSLYAIDTGVDPRWVPSAR